MNYFHSMNDHWLRIGRLQFGLHTQGRKRYFSERNGSRKGPLTIRVGRRAEVAFCVVREQR